MKDTEGVHTGDAALQEAAAPGHSLHFCMVTSFYPPHNFGGDGIFVQRLARALVRRGHRVTIIYCIDAYHVSGGAPVPDAASDEPGITVHALKSPAGALSPLITHQLAVPGLKSRQLQQIFDSNAFDVVHFHNISLVGGPGILDYGSGVKLYTAHEYWLVCPLSTLWKSTDEPCRSRTCTTCTIRSGRPPQWWRHSQLLERKLRNMDALLAPSKFSMQKHAEMGLQLDFEHFSNFLPLDTPAHTPSPDESPPQRPFFLMVGRLEKSKGFARVISLFRHYPAADLLIVGTGQYEAALREQAGGADNIRFTGHLPYEQLVDLYRNARAVVVPSIWFEPFGLVVLEAFAQQTPVVVNRAGALPELVESSGGGYVYDNEQQLREALDRLLDAPALSAQLGARGLQALQKYWSEEVHLKKYLDLIDNIRQRNALS